MRSKRLRFMQWLKWQTLDIISRSRKPEAENDNCKRKAIDKATEVDANWSKAT